MKSLLLATALLAPALFATTASASVTPPTPTGAAPVGFTRTTLTDYFRSEPITGDSGPRRVPLRVWYPAAAPGAQPALTMTAVEQAEWERSLGGLPPGTLDGIGSAATSGARPRPRQPSRAADVTRSGGAGRADERPGQRPRQPRLRRRRHRRAG